MEHLPTVLLPLNIIINYKCVAEERTIFKRIQRSALEPAATRLANAVYHNNQERPRLHLLVYFCSSLSECLHLISTPLTLWFHLADAHKIATQTLERVSPPTFLHFASSWVGSCRVLSCEAPPAGTPGWTSSRSSPPRAWRPFNQARLVARRSVTQPRGSAN